MRCATVGSLCRRSALVLGFSCPDLAALAQPRVLAIAVLESLKPNLAADWTQVAVDEYELGLKVGADLCAVDHGVRVALSRHYFAGKDDLRFGEVVQSAVTARADVIIGPGNNANIIPAIPLLQASKVVSPLVRGVDVVTGIPGFVPMFMPDDVVVDKAIQALRADGLKRVVAIYDPTSPYSLSIRRLASEAAGRHELAYQEYPMASFSAAETALAARVVQRSRQDFPATTTAVIAPFSSKSSLAIGKALEEARYPATLVSFGMPPQYAKLAREQGLTLPIIDVRTYDPAILDLDRVDTWYSKALKRLQIAPKTPLPFFVANTMRTLCGRYTEIKEDWTRFQRELRARGSDEPVWFTSIADGREIAIRKAVANVRQKSKPRVYP